MIDFNYKTPEECGISSGVIQTYLKKLEDAGLSTHNIIIARGYDILFEKYYPPFDASFLHRMYSDTKSWVSVAIGFAVSDGLLELDAPIMKYFPEECKHAIDKRVCTQTVREMLKMSVPKNSINWFKERSSDRVFDYFAKTKVKGNVADEFYYDSTGSFILSAALERATGKNLLDYLREKLLDKIGVSEDIKCLSCPGGHSWGDSGLLAHPKDNLRMIRFLMNKGEWDGETILDPDYISAATSFQIATNEDYEYESFGYGYQIWMSYDGSFFFNGMGGQMAAGYPKKDIIFIINSDNQGIKGAGDIIMREFYETVYKSASDTCEKDDKAYKNLCDYASSLRLMYAKGEKYSPVSERINGRLFPLADNPMGIRYVTLSFNGDGGLLEYENASGEKALFFGLCKNRFTLFPEEGYSRDVGSVYSPGNYYRCACSGAWQSESEFLLEIQAIDEYFGRLWMRFIFEEDTLTLKCEKCAEDFFDTYKGGAHSV